MRLTKAWCCLAVLAVLPPLGHTAAETNFPHNEEARRGRFARLQGDGRNVAGAYLCGRFAMSVGDYTIAADSFLVALQSNPSDPQIGREALAANLLAGRPMTLAIARQVARTAPGSAIAQLVLANDDALVGRWAAAAQHYAALPNDGPFALLQRPLLAWAQFGAGRTDAMRTLLHPIGGKIDAVGGALLLQAGLMADLDNRLDDAERLYTSARTDLGAGDPTLDRALASLQAREGHRTAAMQTLAAARAPGIMLQASENRLQAAVASRPVRDPGDGIAGIYVAVAKLAHQHDADELGDMLFRLALALRPDMTVARLEAAEALHAEGHTRAALGMLAPVAADDILAPSAASMRAAFAGRQRE